MINKFFLASIGAFLMVVSLSANGQKSSMTPEAFFNKVNVQNMKEVCREFYSEDAVFVDPFGKIEGIENITAHYLNLYENVEEIRFDPLNTIIQKDDDDFSSYQEIFEWRMTLVHKRLDSGKPVVLEGISFFRYENGKAVYHRDYFDLGAMLYEKVPVIGSLVRWVKDRSKVEAAE